MSALTGSDTMKQSENSGKTASASPDNHFNDGGGAMVYHPNTESNVHIEMAESLYSPYMQTHGHQGDKDILGPNGQFLSGMEASSLLDITKWDEEKDVTKEEDEVSDFENDVDDLDRYQEAMKEANYVGKVVLANQRAFAKFFKMVNKATKGRLFTWIFLICFTGYFIVAMAHEFGDEGSHRLLGFTIFGVVIWMYPYINRFVRCIARRMYGNDELSAEHETKWKKVKSVLRWLMYFVMIAIMVYVCVDEAKDRPRNLRALLGLLAFVVISFLFSTRPSKVHWHTVFWALSLQFVFAAFVLKWKFGKEMMIWLQARVSEFFANGEKGSELVFGEGYREHVFIFGGVPVLLFSNAVFTLLYYLGVMQAIIRAIGKVLKFFLHATSVETMAVSATIFLEGVATMLLLRPFLRKLSKSELFTVVNGAMSSLGGGYLALLSAFGISLEYLIPAMLISAPATFAICKLMVPEVRDIDDEEADEADKMCLEEKTKYLNAADAAQTGALSMLPVLANVVVVAYTFFTFMTWINHTLGWFGDRVGIRDLSIELISSYVLYPLAWLMGVDPDDCRRVAMLLGYRISVYNLVAFLKLTEMKFNRFKYLEYMVATNFTGTITEHRDDITLDMWNMTLTNGYITERSEAVATYALTGFASGLSVALLMGAIYTLVPTRRRWISRAAIPALIAGTMSNCMTGCFASLFF